MDPTIILRQVGADPLELAADGISKVLAGNSDCCPRHADHNRDLVVELEGPVVDVDLLKLEVVKGP